MVVSPQGEVIVKADDTEQLLYADIDLHLAKPYTSLRHKEFYS